MTGSSSSSQAPAAGIAAAVAAVRIRNDHSFSWLGRQIGVPAAVVRALSPDIRREILAAQIRACLYANFYCTGGPVPQPSEQSRPLSGPDGFDLELTAANHGSGSWESGWDRVGSWHQDRSAVRRRGDGFVAMADRREWRPASGQPDGQPACAPSAETAREPGLVRLPASLYRISPGFCMALGNASPGFGADVVRVYWNLSPAGALQLIHQVTVVLNELQVPFQLKAVDTRQGYDRADSAVLYLVGSDSRAWLPHVTRIGSALAPWLEDWTPAMTFPLAPGIGVAEDPGDGDSFGMSRCGLIAEGVVRAWEGGVTAAEDTMKYVRAAFAETGVDPGRPYRRDQSESPLWALL